MTSSSSLYDSVSGMETMRVQTLHKSKSKSKSLVFTSQSPSKINKLKSNTSTPNSNTPSNKNQKSSSPKPEPPPPLSLEEASQDNNNNIINKDESLQIKQEIPKKVVNSNLNNLNSTISAISSLQPPPNVAQLPKCYSVQLEKSNTYNENRKGIKRGDYVEEKCCMLQKRSNGIFKKWRYVCVVLSGEYLLVFTKPDDLVPKHVYNIKGCTVDHNDKLSVKNLPNVFVVNCLEKDKKVSVIFATNNSVEDEYEWINAIRNNSK